MELFDAHNKIINQYNSYIASFIFIADEKIKQQVFLELGEGKLCPEPLIQFNPGYEKGLSFDSLCSNGTLHPEIKNIFDFTPHKHQEEAFKLGVSGKSFTVTSGTGSGKSLTYLVPIFDHVFKNQKQESDTSVKALLIYPMNALINSQYHEIEKFAAIYKKNNGKNFPTFEQYTGQEKKEKKEEIIDKRPDIILTNYMMLELLLIRPKEKKLRDSILGNLQFLVFDELHTYRGRQGADVAMLIRRIRQSVNNPKLICIGTSATLATDIETKSKTQQIAESASDIFGINFPASHVIEEYLTTNFSGHSVSPAELKNFLQLKIIADGKIENLISSPLANWIEQYIALEKKNNKWERRKPIRLSQIEKELSAFADVPINICNERLQEFFQQIKEVNATITKQNQTNFFLPFKIHQFIRQTGMVYLTLESPSEREILLDPSPTVEKNGERLPLFPVVFSRVTGIEFYRVKLDKENNKFKPWGDDFLTNNSDEDNNASLNGYVILSPENQDDFWMGEDDFENLPASWFTTTKKNGFKPKKEYTNRFPQRVYVGADGSFYNTKQEETLPAWFMQHRLLFDITSMMIYPARTNENTKLARLGNEGRSTATTTLTYNIVKTLSNLKKPSKIQKVLSFIDNRQDAALQSGHFNDFIRTGILRTAINAAIQRNQELDYSNIAQKVFEELNFSQNDYAQQPALGFLSRDNEDAFKKLLFYDVVYDLRRSWRVILPNLEQCGLLKIAYKALEETAKADEEWQNIDILNQLSNDERLELLTQLVEFIRTQFAIQSTEFDRNTREQNEKIIKEKLNKNWRLDDDERIDEPNWMRIENTNRRNVFTQSLHAQSAWGRYLKLKTQHLNLQYRTNDYNNATRQILDKLSTLGYLRKDSNGDVPLYRLNIDVILWTKGDGKMILDQVRMRTLQTDVELKPNVYFKEFYSQQIETLKNRLSGEHTGQLSYELRQKNEKAFRHEQEIPENERLCALFCSPTMELGIDISELIAVHMRNVPPNPANYTQRSGRAGRSGQGALVFTYCGQTNPHDRHYFHNKEDMVAGVVRPIHLNFHNEELWITHLHAIALSIAGIKELQQSIADVLNIENPDLLLKDSVEYELKKLTTDSASKKLLVQSIKQIMIRHEEDLNESYWYHTNWLDDKINQIPVKFNQAFERWREMHRKANQTKFEANRIIESPHIARASEEYRNARREQDRAQRKLELLKNEGHKEESEFFPYRYLASEGFLPGYNFSRLPLRLFLEDSSTGGDFISRPRQLALTEFGPDNVIYYNGAKFHINRMELESRKNDAGQSELALEKMKVFIDSGYVLINEEISRDTSPFSPSTSDDPNKYKFISSLLEMQTMRAYSTERIGCDEEERLRKGYEKETFFHHEDLQSIEDKKVKVINGDDQFLNLHYLPAADLIHINYYWKASLAQQQGGGFAIDTKTGAWLSEKEIETRTEEQKTDFKRVHLFIKEITDALYIEPLPHLQLNKAGVITLMYALKQAIVEHFQLEQSEIDVQLMGKADNPNLFIYEAAEGSLGVISQIAEKVDIFREIVAKAYSICSFENKKDLKNNPNYWASYEDLLDYYNQYHHEIINRFEIKSALELLMASTFDTQKKRTHEEQYKHLSVQYDENSKMEKLLLNYLRANKLRLPDQAQKNMSDLGCYINADFFYEPNICIFCDGSVHDNNEIIQTDKEKRELLERHGFKVLIWYYKTKLEDFVSANKNIFKPVVSTTF